MQTDPKPQEIAEKLDQAKQISIEDFTSRIDDIASGEFHLLDHIPTDHEAQQLCLLPFEVSVLGIKDGRILIIKGTNSSLTSLTIGDLVFLSPTFHAHTHPDQHITPDEIAGFISQIGLELKDVDIDSLIEILTRIPSPDDLGSDVSFASKESEIWTAYGKTTYPSNRQKWNNAQTRIIGNIYSSEDFMTVLTSRTLSLNEKAAKLSEFLRHLGTGFTFVDWNLA